MTWYVVFCGRKPGVYEDWGMCQAQVSGYNNSNYKKYKTMEQAVHAYESFVLCTRGTLDQAQPEKCKINNPDSCIWSLA
ncbi:Translational activator GCN1 [Panicum miliaceum]|uniref:Ribonuclease H n=1 Tax=Panicum miliaceum TaxID=4540 RepID=A0A3L6RDK4_PANMI|nr:Translational activator GCN1 [Panicum miliaceum]